MTARTLRARLPLVVLLVVCVVAGALLGPALLPERETRWEGQALLRAEPSLVAGTGGGTDARSLAVSAAASITTPQVVEAATTVRFASPVTDVRADVRPGTSVVEVLASSDDRETAAAAARSYALALRAARTASDRRRYGRAARVLSESADDGRGRALPDAIAAQLAGLETAARTAVPLAVVRLGTVRERTSGVAPGLATAVGAVGGLLVAVLLALLALAWRRRGRRITTLPALRGAIPAVPVLGAVPPLRTFGARRRRQPFSVDPGELEAFRMVRRGLTDVGDDDAQVVLVTSAQAGAGKSTVAVGLAAAAAETGARVLLVECDLRLPTLAGRLGLRAGPGLAEYIVGDVEPRATLQEARLPGPDGAPTFWVVTAGAAEVPSHELQGPEVGEMLRLVRDGYDVVVLDAPPLVGAVDAGHLVPQADTVALCARLGSITRPALGAAVDMLDRATDLRRVGIVATDVGSSRDPVGETVVYGAGATG